MNTKLKDTYEATPEELAAIDRGLRDAAEGRFATQEQVEAVFAKHRKADRHSSVTAEASLRGDEA